MRRHLRKGEKTTTQKTPKQSMTRTAQHLLRHAHQVVVVRIRHVELARRELRVVCLVDACAPRISTPHTPPPRAAQRRTLVAEQPAELVHPVDAAHHKLLQVQLGRNAQEQVHVQLVVVRHKRSRCCAAGNHVEDRRLHLDVRHTSAHHHHPPLLVTHAVAPQGSRGRSGSAAHS
jgi:hypothetical protein